MLNRDLLEKKMKYIAGYIDEMKQLFEQHSVQEVLNENVLLAFAERKYQLLVDTVLDVNTHIISAKDFQPPDDFESTFMTLADRGVLPHEFAVHLAPCVGLRNRVVHKYEKLDLKRFLRDLIGNIDDFYTYLKHIQAYLKKEKDLKNPQSEI
ncbi:MAG: hypothetical protein A3C90_01260 [Candidatus Magasanikbacteria bacterium RIFCSPHIGHO2_02_FULL_51_14]|uniref:DUF86 domain-containing protein n=1 Tax=Candidatus Magasanikbacteria bacterium RIFCSPHIGHO2_02_FULL_51_14 TaxID=1798683 RepID=A0A1F6MQA5_9BACT|nr:MAG: hypothetical protein A3C90_01260 [Candidatus Magasanikbacteria bacterium RIFCSPHIGHO2_02_FULL_51_14]